VIDRGKTLPHGIPIPTQTGPGAAAAAAAAAATVSGVEQLPLVGSAAQQLRAPLTSMQLTLQRFARSVGRTPQLPAAQITQHLASLQNQAQRLADMIDATDDFARALIGDLKQDLHPAPIELGRLVESVVAEHRKRAEEQGCELKSTVQTVVWGEWDQARVRLVLSGLLRNALVYAPKKPVTITTLVSADNLGCVEVRDEGPGISDFDLRRLQASAQQIPQRSQTGAGWGLWLGAQVARAMGGRLEGRRRQSGGSAFSLLLPLKAAG
jgi:signal transduction histidine kinase